MSSYFPYKRSSSCPLYLSTATIQIIALIDIRISNTLAAPFPGPSFLAILRTYRQKQTTKYSYHYEVHLHPHNSHARVSSPNRLCSLLHIWPRRRPSRRKSWHQGLLQQQPTLRHLPPPPSATAASVSTPEIAAMISSSRSSRLGQLRELGGMRRVCAQRDWR